MLVGYAPRSAPSGPLDAGAPIDATWPVQFGSVAWAAVAANADGALWIGGDFEISLTIEGKTIKPQGDRDVFVRRVR